MLFCSLQTRHYQMIKINLVWFFATLALGLLYVYCISPAPEVVYKFPTPYNAGKVTYSDDTRSCFKFHAHRVPCEGATVPQPIAEYFEQEEVDGL